MGASLTDTLRLLQSRESARARRAAERSAWIQERLPRAGDLLRRRHGARHVWLFGSVATGAVRPESDVDIAVEGVRRIDYMDALSDLMGLFEGGVDLVRLEEAPESLRERVAQEGRAL